MKVYAVRMRVPAARVPSQKFDHHFRIKLMCFR